MRCSTNTIRNKNTIFILCINRDRWGLDQWIGQVVVLHGLCCFIRGVEVTCSFLCVTTPRPTPSLWPSSRHAISKPWTSGEHQVRNSDFFPYENIRWTLVWNVRWTLVEAYVGCRRGGEMLWGDSQTIMADSLSDAYTGCRLHRQHPS